MPNLLCSKKTPNPPESHHLIRLQNANMNLFDRFRNWKRKQRWDRQYKKGKWDGLKDPSEAKRYATIIKYMDYSKNPNPSILDLGCGEGVLNEYLKDSHEYSSFLGIDFSKVSIHKAEQKKFRNAEFKCADLHFFVPEEKYDIIVFNEAFYYINQKEREKVVMRMAASLEPGGIFIVSMYRDAADCWAFFERYTDKIDFAVVETDDVKKYWKVGALRPKA